MIQEEYVLQLEKKMGYCSCAPLEGLYAVKRTTAKLNNRYDEFNREMDFECIKEGDLRFIEDFSKVGEQFVASDNNYHHLLFLYVKAGNVKLTLHNSDLLTKRTLSLEDAVKLSDEGTIISANCAYCDNLIDVVSPETQ